MAGSRELPDSIRRLIVGPSITIMDATRALNDAHKRIVLVADAAARLLGVVTDSNLRHAILERVDLQQPISTIMVTNPVVVPLGTPDHKVLAVMEQTQCYQIPVVGPDGTIVAVRFVDELIQSQSRGGIAVVMAGGVGSRLRPLTEMTPKSLIPVGGRPILFTVIERLLEADFHRVYISLNYLGEAIRAAVAAEPAFGDRVRFIEESAPLGTAGALALLPEEPGETILVMNGDLLTTVALTELRRFHLYERNMLTVAVKEEVFKVPYGIVELDGARIKALREKPQMPMFVNAGIYLVEPLVLGRIPRDRAWNMTDVIEDLLQARLRVGGFPIHEYWIDIGAPEQLARANEDFEQHFGNKR